MDLKKKRNEIKVNMNNFSISYLCISFLFMNIYFAIKTGETAETTIADINH